MEYYQLGPRLVDLNIGYSGGSGGFLLLHLLLLSDQYHAEFQHNKTFAEAFEQQWNISNPDLWKQSETWPDNAQTYASQTILGKIYFFCNPYEQADWNRYPGSTLILYTDYQSQRLIAHYKKANWYYKKNQPSVDIKFSTYRTLLKQWRQHYQNIKDPAWPACNSFRHINRLPVTVQKEVLENPYTAEYLNYQYTTPVKKYQDHWVFDAMLPILTSADIVVRLQDLVNSNGSILTDLLNLPPMNHKQLTFLKLWKQLHPAELLNKIGIN